MIIKWFPRSWVQIKASGQVIYIDPSYMSSYYNKHHGKITFSGAEDDALPEPLEKGGLILVSHIHKDHCKEITIDRLSNENTVILTPRKYKAETDARVKFVVPRSRYHFNGIQVEITDAYNTAEGNSTRKVHKRGECAGYIINIDGKRVYFSGDTDLIPEMREMGAVDIALLPIGGTFTMDMDEAVEAAIAIKPKYVIPVHHLKADPFEFKRKLEGKADIEVINLTIGEEYATGDGS